MSFHLRGMRPEGVRRDDDYSVVAVNVGDSTDSNVRTLERARSAHIIHSNERILFRVIEKPS